MAMDSFLVDIDQKRWEQDVIFRTLFHPRTLGQCERGNRGNGDHHG